VHDHFEGFLISWLMWVFHPYEDQVDRYRAPRRVELWISRSDLQRLYETRSYALTRTHSK
jgi:hypothetical protein